MTTSLSNDELLVHLTEMKIQRDAAEQQIHALREMLEEARAENNRYRKLFGEIEDRLTRIRELLHTEP